MIQIQIQMCQELRDEGGGEMTGGDAKIRHHVRECQLIRLMHQSSPPHLTSRFHRRTQCATAAHSINRSSGCSRPVGADIGGEQYDMTDSLCAHLKDSRRDIRKSSLSIFISFKYSVFCLTTFVHLCDLHELSSLRWHEQWHCDQAAR